jgi:hypothetical protein
MTQMPHLTREDFDFWVEDMDDALDRFRDRLPPQVSDALDGSPKSLDALEAWLLERYPDTESMLAEDQAETVDGAARYVGEILRRGTTGGYWDINLNDERQAFYGLPVVTTADKPTPDAPTTLVTAAGNRRTGTYLRGVIEAKLRRRR